MSPPAVLALDVAILLPRTLRRKVAALNETLASPPEGFRFDNTHLPHITLMQQFVATDRLEIFSRALGGLTRELKTLGLKTGDVTYSGTCATWQVEPTSPLLELHRRLMDGLRPFNAGNGTLDSFVSGDTPPRLNDLDWVTQYHAQAAYDHFDPHITLGVGTLRRLPTPTRFSADQLALCQLGRFCTCRRVITCRSLTPTE